MGKKGHSYEVDIWSLGCIMYTLLVGKPPFETQTLKDTYARIKRNEYTVPSHVAPLAKNLITRLLQHDPSRRPNVGQALTDDFMELGYCPPRLPVSCLTMAPRFDTKASMGGGGGAPMGNRGPLMEINGGRGGEVPRQTKKPADINDCNLADLQAQLKKVVEAKPALKVGMIISLNGPDAFADNVFSLEVPLLEDEAEDPKCLPMMWVSKWVRVR